MIVGRSLLERLGHRAFSILLHLYPAAFREEYGRELTLLFLDRLRAEPGLAARTWGILDGLGGIVADAPRVQLSVTGQDLRSAGRVFSRERWFSAVAVGTVALGIGTTCAVFSVVKSLLLDPLPYRDADRIAMVWVTNPAQGFDRDYTSYPRLLDWRAQSRLVESFAGFTSLKPVLTGVDEPEQLRAARVTPEFFEVMGTAPSLGRAFAATEDQAPVAVLAHGFWLRRFAGDPGVLGRTVILDSIPYTVIGVLPAGFHFPDHQVDLWVPLQPGPAERESRARFWLRCVARMRPGVSLRQAQGEMDALSSRLAAEHGADRGLGVKLVGLRQELSAPLRPGLLLLTAAALGVLLIACANVAAMLTARGAVRRREVAIRTALGAGRRRLVRQMLTETLMLFLAGGLGGLLLAHAGIVTLGRVGPPSLPQLRDVTLDVPMAAFAVGLSLLTGILFGILPGWDATRTDVVRGLGGGAKGATRGQLSQRFRRGLVVVQMAVATLVLAAAGLLVRSLVQLQRTDLGLESGGVLTAAVELPMSRYRDLEKRLQFLDGLLERVRTIPGVVSTAVGSSVLLGPLPDSTDFTPEGAPETIKQPMTLDGVTPDFFRTLGMRLRQGRSFTEADRPGGTTVAIINETAARRHWGNVNPLGRRFKLGSGDESPWLTIVGVVADARRGGADQMPFAESYQPYWQYPTGTMVVLVRSSADPASMAPLVRNALREMDPQLPLGGAATLDQLLSELAAGRRFTASLLAGYGGLAVVLTGVGLYGLLAYLVALRQQEIAVRLALGATRAAVLRLVLGQALGAAAVGALAGAVAAVGAARLMRGLLFGTHPADPVTHLTVGALLCVVAALAAWAPGRRAVQVDPMVALRSE